MAKKVTTKEMDEIISKRKSTKPTPIKLDPEPTPAKPTPMTQFGRAEASKPVEAPTTLEQRIEAKKTVLMTLQDQLRRQIDGVANQIYVLDQLLNPAPEESPEEPSENPPEPSPIPPRGTI